MMMILMIRMMVMMMIMMKLRVCALIAFPIPVFMWRMGGAIMLLDEERVAKLSIIILLQLAIKLLSLRLDLEKIELLLLVHLRPQPFLHGLHADGRETKLILGVAALKLQRLFGSSLLAPLFDAVPGRDGFSLSTQILPLVIIILHLFQGPAVGHIFIVLHFHVVLKFDRLLLVASLCIVVIILIVIFLVVVISLLLIMGSDIILAL